MSHIDASPLATYNSLRDPHLSGYFSHPGRRKHLVKSGLIKRNGRLVAENEYRRRIAQKEHRKHVRDVLAQAIVHKALDMERQRQVAIRKKLEEIAKLDLVARVRADENRKSRDDYLPLLSSGRSRPKSAPAPKSKRMKDDDQVVLVTDASGMPMSPLSSTPRSSGSRPVSGKLRPRSAKYPKGEIDDRHLYSLDQHTLHEYKTAKQTIDSGRGPSPYTSLPAPFVPTPPRSARTPSHSYKMNKRRTTVSIEGPPKNGLMLHRTGPVVKKEEQVQTLVQITMHYFGTDKKICYEKLDPRDEVVVLQQHCGGNTLAVYKGLIEPSTDFTFVSRRHRGFPFGLTLYVNGVEDFRVSTCCEYKHSLSAKLGGHFGIVNVKGGSKCYKCIVEEKYKKKPAKEKQKKKGAQDEETTEVAVTDEGQDKEADKTERTDVDVRGLGEETNRDDDNDHVSVSVDNVSKAEDEYEDDFEKEDGGKQSDLDSETKVKARRSSSSSSSSSRGSSPKPRGRKGSKSSGSSAERTPRNRSVSSSSRASSVDSHRGKTPAPQRRRSSSSSRSPSPQRDRSSSNSSASSVRREKSRPSDRGQPQTRSRSTSSDRNIKAGAVRDENLQASPSAQHKEPEEQQEPKPVTTYKIAVKTGSVMWAGTDANVSIRMYGRDKDTGDIPLKESDEGMNKFERGQTDTFTVKAADIGNIEKIRIGHDGTGLASGWNLEQVFVDVPSSGKHYTFTCNRWLDTDKEDGQISVELTSADYKKWDEPTPIVRKTSVSSDSSSTISASSHSIKSNSSIEKRADPKKENDAKGSVGSIPDAATYEKVYSQPKKKSAASDTESDIAEVPQPASYEKKYPAALAKDEKSGSEVSIPEMAASYDAKYGSPQHAAGQKTPAASEGKKMEDSASSDSDTEDSSSDSDESDKEDVQKVEEKPAAQQEKIAEKQPETSARPVPSTQLVEEKTKHGSDDTSSSSSSSSSSSPSEVPQQSVQATVQESHPQPPVDTTKSTSEPAERKLPESDSSSSDSSSSSSDEEDEPPVSAAVKESQSVDENQRTQSPVVSKEDPKETVNDDTSKVEQVQPSDAPKSLYEPPHPPSVSDSSSDDSSSSDSEDESEILPLQQKQEVPAQSSMDQYVKKQVEEQAEEEEKKDSVKSDSDASSSTDEGGITDSDEENERPQSGRPDSAQSISKLVKNKDHVFLNNIEFSDHKVKQLCEELQVNRGLKSLKIISRNNTLSDEYWEDIVNVLKQPGVCPELSSIYLQATLLDPSATLQLAYIIATKPITHVTLHSTFLKSDGLQLWNQAFSRMKILQVLDLTNAHLTDASINELSNLLSTGLPKIELVLDGNKRISPVGWKNLFSTVGQNNGLQSLSLADCNLNTELIENMCDHFQDNKTLRKLNIEENGLYETDAYYIKELLFSTAIGELQFEKGNYFGEQRAAEIKKKLKL